MRTALRSSRTVASPPSLRRILQLLSVSLLVCTLLPRCSPAAQYEPCSTWITVDRDTATDCSPLSTGSLANTTCSDLQDVLLSLTRNRTLPLSTSDCIDVSVQPGDYLITDFISISHNLRLHGEGNVTVRFNFTGKFDPTQTNEAYYVWSFFNADYIEMSGFDFSQSPGIITIVSVTTAVIKDCSFRYFFQGALDLYNCDFTQVINCTFEDNGPTSVIKQQKYRGHAGGLSIGYYNTAVFPGPEALVSGCVFRNNTSNPASELVQTTSEIVQSMLFTGRGGGCTFPINPVYSLNATIEDCLFERNFALSFGGGLYVAFNGREHHTVTLHRVKFVKNQAPTAGGLEVGFIRGGIPGADNKLLAYDSEFFENKATQGGGVFFFTLGPTADSDGRLGNFASFENCSFVRNTAVQFGAAIGVATLLFFQEIVNIRPFQITSCTFISNDAGGGGAMGVAYFPLSFNGSTVFETNRGRTLVVVASKVEVHGDIHFIGNDGDSIDGGALYVTSLGQLVLFRGANITFQNNTGVLGAALVGDTLFVPSVVSRLAYNPLCFLLYEDYLLPPDEWENVTISFSGNQAVVSSAVYLSNLNLCSYVRLGHPWFDSSRVFRWNFVKFSEDNKNSAHRPDQFNPEWYVQTPADSIVITTTNINAYPGEMFSLGLKALDEINRTTSAVVRISDLADDPGYVFDPGVITFDSIALAAINTSFYTLEGAADSRSNLIVDQLIGEPSQFGSFWVQSLGCPPGYVLAQGPGDSGYKTCACNFNNDKILQCNGRGILIETGYWGTVDADSADTIFLYSCPPGYCRCQLRDLGDRTVCINVFNSTESDYQCICDRKGKLCGECRDGKGVSALLNKCTTCSDASGLIILVLIVLDIGIFVFLLLIMKPFPTWVYPCVFYLQILPYLTEHFPLTFSNIQPYLYYISSALSFYFVYDFCLYSSLSPLISYFIRYLPLFIIVITASIVLSIRRYLKKHALSWHGLWWIVLLLYTHVLHTSMSILNCPILPDRDGSHVSRWYIDGSVKCFNGGHAPLALLAIFVLAVCVAIIPLSLGYITAKLHRLWVLRRSFEPLVVPFKEQYKWWSSVELGRRVILVLFIVSFPQNEYPAIFILMVTVSVYGYVQPFKQLAVNILETVLATNTLILLLLRHTKIISDELGSLGNQPLVNETGSCRDGVEGVTGISWLLLPVYYMPLIISCSAGAVWAAFRIRKYYVTRWRQPAEETAQAKETHGHVAEVAHDQNYGVSEMYLEVRACSSGEVAMLSYRPTQTEDSCSPADRNTTTSS